MLFRSARVLATRHGLSAADSRQPSISGIALSDLYPSDILDNWSGNLGADPIKLDPTIPVVFANGIKLTTGPNNPLFTTYLYQNAYTSSSGDIKLDALVTLTGLNNATVFTFDSPTVRYDNPDYFQPIVNILGGALTPGAIGGSAKISI